MSRDRFSMYRLAIVKWHRSRCSARAVAVAMLEAICIQCSVRCVCGLHRYKQRCDHKACSPHFGSKASNNMQDLLLCGRIFTFVGINVKWSQVARARLALKHASSSLGPAPGNKLLSFEFAAPLQHRWAVHLRAAVISKLRERIAHSDGPDPLTGHRQR